MPHEVLNKLNWVDLFPDWKDGLQRLLPVLTKGRPVVSKAKIQKKKTLTAEFRVALVDLDLGLTNWQHTASQLNETQDFFEFATPRLPALDSAVIKIEGVPNLAVFKVPSSYIKHSSLPVDFVACFTKYPLADKDGREILSDYLAVSSNASERFTFLSAAPLLEFTRKAKCTFEMGLVFIVLGELIDFFSKTGYHKETRGCVMDYCEDWEDMVIGLKKRKLCPQCLSRITHTELKASVKAILSSDI